MVLELYLKKADYTVYSSHSGEHCIHKAEEVSPDLIFLDVVMSEKDEYEYEVGRHLESHGKLRLTSIISLTG